MSADSPGPLPQSAGSLLAAERERQGLTRPEMSRRLHLSVSQVEALEAGDFGRLAGGPFIKGFVRNYAKALGLDAEAVASLVLRDMPPPPRPPLLVPSQDIRFDPFSRRLGAGVLRAGVVALGLLVLGISVLYWWLNVYPAASQPGMVTSPVGAPPAELPGEAPPLPADPSTAVPPAGGSESPAPGQSAAPTTAPPAAAARPPSPVASTTPTSAAARVGENLARLRVLAAERTWVEIVDGAGERVASRHVDAGAPAEFLALPPLRLAIGNAPATRVLFNGREVDLAPHTQAAVARLTVE